MFEEDVKDKDGNVKHVVASSQEELDDAAKVASGQTTPVHPNINVPVQKGYDLTEVQEDASVKLVDGRGAHNSPNDAVDADGNKAGDPDVPVVALEEAPYLAVDGEPVETKEVPKATKASK